MKREAEITLPTDLGKFKVIAYSNSMDRMEHIALVKGGVDDGRQVLVRIHSECLTGDVFGSRRCDCGEQLAAALTEIENAGSGVLLYMRQEGRGIGLINKLKAYALQEQGMDTVAANVHLGFAPDQRDYGIAAQMLKDLGVSEVRLLTNNPRKVRGLEEYGLKVADRLPLQMCPNESNERYLLTKKQKLGHLLEFAEITTNSR